MQDYPEQVTDFILANFEPSTPDWANVFFTTRELARFLFSTFPVDCVSDFEINDIMLSLGYNRHTYISERTVETKNGFVIHKNLENGWCLKSPFSLNSEEISGL